MMAVFQKRKKKKTKKQSSQHVFFFLLRRSAREACQRKCNETHPCHVHFFFFKTQRNVWIWVDCEVPLQVEHQWRRSFLNTVKFFCEIHLCMIPFQSQLKKTAEYVSQYQQEPFFEKLEPRWNAASQPACPWMGSILQLAFYDSLYGSEWLQFILLQSIAGNATVLTWNFVHEIDFQLLYEQNCQVWSNKQDNSPTGNKRSIVKSNPVQELQFHHPSH